MAAPIVSWYETENSIVNEVTGLVQYGTVDADTDSGQKTFYIWNNRDSVNNVSKMEEVTFTTRDRLGGTGDTSGNIVEAVRDDWFQVRVDSLDEITFTPVGKSALKSVGTIGSTTNPNASTASTWVQSVGYTQDEYVKPTVENGFVYKVTIAGTSGGTEPVWSTTDGGVVTDGTVEYTTIQITRTPATQEILGVENTVLDDGTDAVNSGGNFVELTVFAEVPVSATAGKNKLLQRISFRYV